MVDAPNPIAPSIIRTPAIDGPAKQCGDGRKRARGPKHGAFLRPEPCEAGDSDPDDGSECDQRGLWAEHCTEGEGADRGERHARSVGEKGSLSCEPAEWFNAAVTGQEPARDHDDACADHRQADDQVPRRSRLAQRGWQVMPEPLLEFVHERKEGGRYERRWDPDHRAKEDQAKVRDRTHLGVCVLAHPISSTEATCPMT